MCEKTLRLTEKLSQLKKTQQDMRINRTPRNLSYEQRRERYLKSQGLSKKVFEKKFKIYQRNKPHKTETV